MLSELNAIGRVRFQPSDVPAVVSLLAGIGDGDSSGAAGALVQLGEAVVGRGADAQDLESLSPPALLAELNREQPARYTASDIPHVLSLLEGICDGQEGEGRSVEVGSELDRSDSSEDGDDDGQGSSSPHSSSSSKLLQHAVTTRSILY
eukprot:COSAG05_NODE_1145_length_5733_cov_3.986865_2_plen_149_part_00